MHARGTLSAVVGLVLLGGTGLALLASTPDWRPPLSDGDGPRRAFVVGMLADPSTRNIWARSGPNNTVYNSYVTAGSAPTLFTYSPRGDWIPSLAEDFPSPLRHDDEAGVWRSAVRFKRDQIWSDGTPITAQDVAFTFATFAAFGPTRLGGGVPGFAPEDVIDHVDALGDLTVEFSLKKRDARFRFGVLTGAPIVQRGFWEPHVKAALASADPPMGRRSFRRAVATLIDREFVVSQVLQGAVTFLNSTVPEANSAWHNPNLVESGHGMSRADRLREAVRILESDGFSWTTRPQLAPDGTLARAGRGLHLPNGVLVPSREILVTADSEDRVKFGEWIARWLSDAGVPVRLARVPFNLLVERQDRQEFDLVISGYQLGRYPSHLWGFFHSGNAGLRGPNVSGFKDPEYDRLAERFTEEADDMERAKALAFELQQMLNKELPWIPLFSNPSVEAYRSDQVRFPTTSLVGGLQINPFYGFADAVQLVD